MEEIKLESWCLLSDLGLTETVNVTVPPTLQMTQKPLLRPHRGGWILGLGSHLNANQPGEPKLHALTINFHFESLRSFPSHYFHLSYTTAQTGGSECSSAQLSH